MTPADLADRATITIPEVASLLGIGVRQAYAAAARGDIPAIRIGDRRLIVPTCALVRWMQEAAGTTAAGAL
ncbi:MAG: helix-turn-helix domain-containing protein [Actinomycetota bacterium]